MNESAAKDGALREILDRLLSEIDEVIALIARPLACDRTDRTGMAAEPARSEADIAA